jgi:hypothetical protein
LNLIFAIGTLPISYWWLFGRLTDEKPALVLPKGTELIILQEILFTTTSHPPTKPILTNSNKEIKQNYTDLGYKANILWV